MTASPRPPRRAPRPAPTAAALPLALLLVLVALAPQAAAHLGGIGPAVETRLEIPAWVAWVTGAAVVALSFVVVGAFLTRTSRADARPRATPGPAGPAHPRPVGPGHAAGLAALALVVANGVVPGATGLWPATALWLVAWAALPLMAYALRDPWPRISPFAPLAPLADRARRGRPPMPYPARLGAWPAVLLLLGLIGLEVTRAGGQDPALLGRLALAYTLLTFTGMARFGSAAWLANAEVFTRAFRWWGSMGPLGRDPAGRLRWRGFGAGLREAPVQGMADVAFVVALLLGVNYDGFLATGPGQAALAALGALTGEAGARIVVLLLGFAAFLGAFLGCAHLVRRVAESLASVPVLAGAFAASLVPIAAGYHAAHNAFYLWEHAPRVALALDDPLGLGWSLLGLHGLAPSGPLPADLLPWLAAMQMLLIVAGHVLAVVVAHRLAFRAFPSRVQAVRSELPLTAAMVFYTLVGLGIVSSGGHAAPAPETALPAFVGIIGAATWHAGQAARAQRMAVAVCPRCGEPFARQAHLDLHTGRAHGGDAGEAALSAEERAAFEAAVSEEEAWLRMFRRRMRAALGFMPSVFVVIGTGGLLAWTGIGLYWVALLTPGTLAFGGLMAYMAWQQEPEPGAPAGAEGPVRAPDESL